MDAMNGKELDYLKKAKIMVIDDDPATLEILNSLLVVHGSEVVVFPSGIIARLALNSYLPDLILLAANLADTDAYVFCHQLKQDSRLRDIPVLMLSTDLDPSSKVRAFNLGAVDFITKPFYFDELRARIAVFLNLCMLENKLKFQQMVEKKVREISDAQQATIFAMAKLAEQRDEDTGAHLERVREFCRLLAVRLGEDSPYSHYINDEFVDCIQNASPLHDIGKVAIPDRILLKPGTLTPQEFEIMKEHTVLGAENLQQVYNLYSGNSFIGMGIEIALYHHERWNGSGYPDGLVGKNIPLPARIMAVADFYDALRSDRCYRKGFCHEQVCSMLLEGEGSHFDPELVKAFKTLEVQFRIIHKEYI
ncbi:MAG: HD domain-containing protein [Trichlorobacter sp.]|nr:HD domain-containing protein [Trichlorobacter sp.]